MKDISKEPWAEFAEEMMSHKVTEAVVMARSESEDRVVTNYYNASYEMRWAFLGHMIENLVIDTIQSNQDEIREILMTDEELAEFLESISKNELWLEWLKQEADKDGEA